MKRGARRSGRRRVLVAALSSAGVLLPAGFSPLAPPTRPPTQRAATPTCAGEGGTSILLSGGGERLVSETDIPVCVTGRLTVTFAGDPADGCAAEGLCGYAGTETWQPQGVGDLTLSTFQQRGRRSSSATMLLGGPGNPVLSSVQRSQPPGTTTACSDQNDSDPGFFSLPVSHGRVTITLRDADQPLLGTRCAGPLYADLITALPSRTLRLSRVLHGRSTIDLTGDGKFTSHGLTGTVDSTVVLVLGRPRRSSDSSSATPPAGIPQQRLVEVEYRVTHVSGSAIATVGSSSDPSVCGPFDACGLRGDIDIVPGAATGGSVYLTASAPLRRPKRDLLTALGVARGADASGIRVQGGGGVSVRGEVVADLTQGVTACRDQAGLRETAIELSQRARRLEVSVSPALSQAGDPLRTRCPGPELGQRQLTSGSVALNVIRRRSFTLAVHGRSFSDGPYRVTTNTTLVLTLRRTRIRTQILP